MINKILSGPGFDVLSHRDNRSVEKQEIADASYRDAWCFRENDYRFKNLSMDKRMHNCTFNFLHFSFDTGRF